MWTPLSAEARARRRRLLNAILVVQGSVSLIGMFVGDLLKPEPTPLPWLAAIPVVILGFGTIAWINRTRFELAAGVLIGLTFVLTAASAYNASDELGVISAGAQLLAPVLVASLTLGPWLTLLISAAALMVVITVGLTTDITINAAALLILLHLSVQPLLVLASLVWQLDMKALSDQARAREMLLTNISHELRTPLNAIMGLTELTLSTTLNAEQRRYLGLVRTSAKGLLHLISDLLDLAKTRAQKVSLLDQPFDPASQATLVVESLRPQAEAKGLELKLRLEDLPPAVRGDMVRVRQVLVNLVGNAIKYTDNGQVDVLARYTPEQVLHLQVSDTGIGIEHARLDEIFEAYAQVDTGRDARGGAGLGLAITAQIVERMNGTVQVNSTLGVGSVFAAALPLPTTDEEVPDDSWSNPLGGDAPEARSGRTALIVEDNAVNRFLLETLLKKQGWAVLLAEDGSEAFALAPQADIVLMDVQMPGIDGLVATRRLRAKGLSVPIVALTARTGDEDREACMEAGMDAFLTKPLDVAKVLETITQLTN